MNKDDSSGNTESSTRRMTVLVRHPPNDENPKAMSETACELYKRGSLSPIEWSLAGDVLQDQIDLFNDYTAPNVAHWLLISKINDYETSKKPELALLIFMLCHEIGAYPPLSVLSWIANAFEAFAESEGKEDLIALLGLKASRGRQNPYRESQERDKRVFRAYFIDGLIKEFGITQSEAASMVHAREQSRGNHCPSAEWLEEEYRKKWKKEFENRPDIGIKSDEKSRREVLDSYPRDCIPERLR